MNHTIDFTRNTLLDRIQQAEQRLVEGAQFLSQQRGIVEYGMAQGEDVSTRRNLLTAFQELHEFRVTDIDRLRKLLIRFPPAH